MPRRRRIEEISNLYIDLVSILIPKCKLAYEKIGKTDNALVKMPKMPATAAVSALIRLCNDRCQVLQNEIHQLAKTVDVLVLNGKYDEAAKECDTIFDDYKTTAALVAHLAGYFLGLDKEAFNLMYNTYMDNLYFYANNIIHDPSFVSEPHFTEDVLILLATLNILPPGYSSVSDFVNNIPSVTISKEYLDIIYALSYDINSSTISNRIISFREKVNVQAKPSPKPVSRSSVVSYFARGFIEDLISHCEVTWKKNNINVDYLNELADDPDFYEPISAFIRDSFKGKDGDYETKLLELISYIDCSILSSRLKGLSGAALRNAFSSLLKDVITCAASSEGNPDRFAKCIKGEKTPSYGPEEAQQQQRLQIESAFTEAFDEILESEGLKPVESYERAKAFIKYFISLLKKYGLNTTDYTKLETIISKPEIYSQLEKILNSIPESYRKEILSALTSLLSSISKYPPEVQKKALELFSKMSEPASSLPNPESYFNTISELVTQIMRTFPYTGYMFAYKVLDEIIQLIDKLPESERLDVLSNLDIQIKKLLESGTISQKSVEKAISEALQKRVEKQPESAAVEEEELERIKSRDELANIIIKYSKEECKVYESETEYIRGPCIHTLYFKYRETPMLYVKESDKLYIITDQRIVSAADGLVALGRKTPYDAGNIIGTNMNWVYITSGTNPKKFGELYAFLPYSMPNFVARRILIYSRETLPSRYAGSSFTVGKVFDDIAILVSRSDDSVRLIVPADNFKEGDIVRVIEGKNVVKWGEQV